MFELPPSVSSTLNSLIAAPNSAPIEPSFNSLNPDRLKASALRVAEPVACSILNKSPTLKSPCWSVDTQYTLPPFSSVTSSAWSAGCEGVPG